MLANMIGGGICRPCSRDHSHVKIEGKWTKGSAIYCRGLVIALADMFQKHLTVQSKIAEQQKLDTGGLENPLVNDILKKVAWGVGSVWKWTGRSHINVLELASAFQALKAAAKRGGGRVVIILDSYVAVRVIAKGRSSAEALKPLTRKIMALCLAFGIAVSVHFGPTRLNVADDPTRSVQLRTKQNGPRYDEIMEEEELFKMASFHGFGGGRPIGFPFSLEFALSIFGRLPLSAAPILGLALLFPP